MENMAKVEQLKKNLSELSERMSEITKTHVKAIADSNDMIAELASNVGWPETEKFLRRLRGEKSGD